MPEGKRKPRIYVLAGTNGAGKSSIAGAMFAQSGAAAFDPDAAARRIMFANPGLSQQQANSAAWYEGVRLLRRAIDERLDFAFETTLGGTTVAGLLAVALARRIEVRVWYVGLEGPELHIERVRSRVARGGHDIPEEEIRRRYDASRRNLIRLLPTLTELRVYDNTHQADPADGLAPQLVAVLHMSHGRVVATCDLRSAPGWAKPILTVALRM